MNPGRKQIDVLVETKVEEDKFSTLVHTDLPEIETNETIESLERESFRSTFLRTEMVEVESGITKPYILLEENPFYSVFKPEKANDPFCAFEDYLRRSVGEGVYRSAEFSMPSLTETGTLLGVYERMVNEIKDFGMSRRKGLEAVDQQLTFFFKDRIDHFVKTIDERIHSTALARADGSLGKAYEQLEKQLALKVPAEFLQEKKQEVLKILENNLEKGEKRAYQFKAYKLLAICREIFDRTNEVLQNTNYSDPLTPDNYEV
jgi:hypothetical protein